MTSHPASFYPRHPRPAFGFILVGALFIVAGIAAFETRATEIPPPATRQATIAEEAVKSLERGAAEARAYALDRVEARLNAYDDARTRFRTRLEDLAQFSEAEPGTVDPVDRVRAAGERAFQSLDRFIDAVRHGDADDVRRANAAADPLVAGARKEAEAFAEAAEGASDRDRSKQAERRRDLADLSSAAAGLGVLAAAGFFLAARRQTTDFLGRMQRDETAMASLKDALEGAPEGRAIFAPDGRLVAANMAFWSLTGVAPEADLAAIRRGLTSDGPWRGWAAAARSNAKSRAQRGGRDFDLLKAVGQGGAVLLAIAEAPADGRGAPSRRVSGDLAHDFNNLLTAVIGNLDLLAGRVSEDRRAFHLANNALRAAKRGRALTKEILSFGGGKDGEKPEPDEKARAATEKAARPKAAAKGGGRVALIVEDDPDVRELACQTLREADYVVVEARTAKDALDYLKGPAPVDVLFTDIVMPDEISGFELAREARSRRPQIKIAYTSGYSESALRSIGAGVVDAPVLNKPYGTEDLAQFMHRVFEERVLKLPIQGKG